MTPVAKDKTLSEIFIEGESPLSQAPLNIIKPKKRSYRNTVFKAKDGYAFNPIFRHMERNEPCLCGSGRKWKACCMRTQPRVVSQNVEDHMALRIAKMKSDRSADAVIQQLNDSGIAIDD